MPLKGEVSMKGLLLLVFSAVCLSACAYSTRVPYQVSSTPTGARVYVDGVSMGITPVQIELVCDKIYRCPADDSCSWETSDYVYKVTAYPTQDNPGQSQTKRVDPCRLKTPGQIHFDVGTETVVEQNDAERHLTAQYQYTPVNDLIR